MQTLDIRDDLLMQHANRQHECCGTILGAVFSGDNPSQLVAVESSRRDGQGTCKVDDRLSV